MLGGESRVPNVRRWASLAEVQLDEQVLPRVAVAAASLHPAASLHARRVLSSAGAALTLPLTVTPTLTLTLTLTRSSWRCRARTAPISP